uniref:Myosin N-terminal SH3-like domain-containing protein n=1 Tax=Parascaris equorum TaxID=6256 RepID=A0A914R3L9_PAREQ
MIAQFVHTISDNAFQDQSKPYDSKKNCWVPDAEEGFIAAEITSTKGDLVTVVTARGNEVHIFEIIRSLPITEFAKFSGIN